MSQEPAMAHSRFPAPTFAVPLLATVALAVALVPARPALASAGDLDGSFGSGGKVITNMRVMDDINDMALQSDGKIVVAGSALDGSHSDFALARYRADGSLDPSFGTGGLVATSMSAIQDVAEGVAIQADGKIVAAGFSSNGRDLDFALARYTPDGSLDRSFGVRGVVTTPIGSGSDDGEAVAIQADGRIVVAGSTATAGSFDFALVRYRPGGALDASFGSGGTVITPIGSAGDFGTGVAIQANGRIVAAGYTQDSTNYDFALARYRKDGSLDGSFGSGGTAITPIGADAAAHDVAVQEDGKIVAAGDGFNGNSYDFALARYKADGSPDGSFGAGGTRLTPIGPGTDGAKSVGLQSDGKIVAAGYSFSGTNFDFALARYRTNGSLDGSFGSGGTLVTAIGARENEANAVAIQANGKIIAAGHAFKGTDSNFAVARYLSDGSLDGSFGSRGKVVTAVGSVSSTVSALAIQANGKVLAAGSAFNGSSVDFALARYNRNGSLDLSFGSGGRVLTPIGSSTDVAYAVAIQDDGKIVLAGVTASSTEFDAALARYNTDGSLDPSFGVGGKVTTDFAGSYDEAQGVAIQDDGKIVVAGRAYRGIGPSFDFALARYDTNGALDGSFGAGGKVTTDFGGLEEAYDMAIQDDGRIVAAGSANTGSNNQDFALARYETNGALDGSFGVGGKVLTDFGSTSDFARAVALQADGKIVAAGSTSSFPDYPFGLARYNGDGALDGTFGAGGKVTTLFGSALAVAEDVAVQADGRIVAAGRVSHGNGQSDFGLVRYRRNGSRDPAFGSNGRVTTRVGSSSLAYAVAIQDDGRIVAAGDGLSDFTTNFALARYVA